MIEALYTPPFCKGTLVTLLKIATIPLKIYTHTYSLNSLSILLWAWFFLISTWKSNIFSLFSLFIDCLTLFPLQLKYNLHESKIFLISFVHYCVYKVWYIWMFKYLNTWLNTGVLTAFVNYVISKLSYKSWITEAAK